MPSNQKLVYMVVRRQIFDPKRDNLSDESIKFQSRNSPLHKSACAFDISE